jgi:hypothetical protein
VNKTPRQQKAQVRTRVVDALMEAYREDASRPEIVAALAALADRRAAPVFVAALGDARRAGSYFEAAVTSARLIGELQLKSAAPEVIQALRGSLASPREDRNTWLERALVQTLARLGDPRALDVLIEVLDGDPTRQDFYLNKLAARAIGELGGRRAIRPLVRSLSTARHGLLLFEESRQALCQIGPGALPELLAAASRRDRRGQPAENAAAALRVLADIAEPGTVPQLAELARPKDPLEYRLAAAEALIRSRATEGEQALMLILRDRQAALTARRRAADLLGWYGSHASASAVLEADCQGSGMAQNVLCWNGALAFSRLADHDGGQALDELAQARRDPATARNIEEYRSRLKAAACRDDRACLRTALRTSSDWRQRERAALELGRIAAATTNDAERAEVAVLLASAFALSHPQVQEAILVALERVGPISGVAAEVAARLRGNSVAGASAKDELKTPPAISSRALCASQSWYRRSRERR